MKIPLRISKRTKKTWEETLSKLHGKEGWCLTSLLHLHMKKLIKTDALCYSCEHGDKNDGACYTCWNDSGFKHYREGKKKK